MRFASLRQSPPFDRLLFLLSRWTPKLDRVLVIESGARPAASGFSPGYISKSRLT